MTAADGTKIAERWAITYRIQRDMTRSFRNEPDTVATAQRTMKLIEELSAAEQRERVLREALKKARHICCYHLLSEGQWIDTRCENCAIIDAALATTAQPQTGGTPCS